MTAMNKAQSKKLFSNLAFLAAAYRYLRKVCKTEQEATIRYQKLVAYTINN